eukprot:evm.model.NODE_20349_length_1074_cov_31.662012.1
MSRQEGGRKGGREGGKEGREGLSKCNYVTSGSLPLWLYGQDGGGREGGRKGMTGDPLW